MKNFSIVSIILSTLLIGYFFIIGLPKIAKVGPITTKEPLQGIYTAKNESASTQIEKTNTPSLNVREKCNALVLEKTFATGLEADSFLDTCLKTGAESAINTQTQTATENTQNNKTEPVETNVSLPETSQIASSDKKQKCVDFMAHARFESQAASDTFLKNCLAGK